jgi:hypothetical protein
MVSLRPFCRVVVLLASAALAYASPQKQESATELPIPQDPNQYVREVVKHELDAANDDHTLWRHHFHREDEKNNYDRDVIEAKDGQLARTVLLNGQPLTPELQAQDEARMKKLVEDPSERAKREKRAKSDGDKAMQMFKAIPDAFLFRYDTAKSDDLKRSDPESHLVCLAFSPNPHYDPPNVELKVFRSLSGKMWIDRAAGRLVRIDGQLFEDVTFGWGILGRLNKGGTFAVVQKDVGGSHWEIVAVDVSMTGKAVLFKTITKKQKERFTDFHRMPDDLTIAQAYQMLELGENSVSAASQSVPAKSNGK